MTYIAALLFMFSFAVSSISAEETLIVRDHGRSRRFSFALDEVSVELNGGRSVGRRVAERASRDQMSALASETTRSGEICDLVLYEAGRARSAKSRRILTSRILLRLAPGADLERLCADEGVLLLASPPYAKGMHVVACRHAGQALDKAAALARRPGVLEATPLLRRLQAKRLIPNDPQFSSQWHLQNTGQGGGSVGTDINVESVWDSYTGSNVLVGIVDDGLEVTHPDLQPNVNTVLDWDWNGNDGDPSPTISDDHGTPCAGLVGAKGNNTIGVCGVAFDATLIGMRLIADLVSDATEAEAFSHSNGLIHVQSNSWGPYDDGDTLEGPGPLGLAALRSGAENGRGGLGTIYMWAGGNGGTADMSNKDGYANSIYTISVTAIDNSGNLADYSERGCNHVVSALSSGGTRGITTTDLGGGYTSGFGGTSAATPIAAGVVALMLQANPGLGWRDVQEILVRTATKNDPADGDWADNGVGYAFSHKYGAGLLNAAAAVATARTWTNLPPQQTIEVPQTGLSVSIPDNAGMGVERTFNLSGDSPLRVEHVAVTVDIVHGRRGQLEVLLTSPAGTVSRLMETHGDSGDDYDGWTFTSVHHWGENSTGTWTVTVKDSVSGTAGTLRAVTLTVYGSHSVTPTEPPGITSPLAATGAVGDYFFYRITASNYPTAFGAWPLPDGLSVQTSSGVISGTPTVAGTNVVTVSAANAIGTNTASLTLTIEQALPKPPVITSLLSADGIVDRPFVYQIEATGNPTHYGAVGLPLGLSIHAPSGLISGTPAATGTNPVLITATNADGSDSNTLTIVVYPPQGTPLNQAVDNVELLFTSGGDAPWVATSADAYDGEDAARSGVIGDNQTSYLETRITGPAVLTFWWASSSEKDFDLLSLSIDGTDKRVVSGESGWRSVSCQIPVGLHVVRWTYSKDGNTTDGSDAAYLDRVTVASGALPTLGDALDHTAHAWTDSGDAPWFAQTIETFDLTDAAASGGIGDDSITGFQTTVDGPGWLSFYWKVSSEVDFDYLVFAMDGATQALISGEVDWEQHSVNVPPGASHTLAWTYEKDLFVAEGQDAAWVDRVVYVPDGTATGYAAWAAQVFSPTQQTNPVVGARSADPDLDGYDNLMEYALDMDPLTSGTHHAPTVQFMDGDFVYRYRHDNAKTSLSYTLERTPGSAPGAWQSATSAVVDTRGSVDLREHRQAITNQAFIRLKVTDAGL